LLNTHAENLCLLFFTVAAAAIAHTLRAILGRAASHLSVTADGSVQYSSSSSSSSSSSDGSSEVTVLNNLDWFGSMSFLSFLRDIGKYARVGQMLAKESVSALEVDLQCEPVQA
jgi:tyrosyl-tRNA synthetase